MKKVICLLLIFAMSLSLCACSSSDGSTTVDIASAAKSGVYSGQNTAELADYEYNIENLTYDFSFAYSDFINNGWIIQSDIAELQAGECVLIPFLKEDKLCNFYVFNFDNCPLPVAECYIAGFQWARDTAVDIKFPKNINPLEATIANIRDEYGNPTTEENNVFTYSFYTDRSVCTFTFDETGTLQIADIKKAIISQKYNNEPKYISQYVQPAALGNFGDPIFTHKGVLQQLPLPLTQYLGNGYTLYSGSTLNDRVKPYSKVEGKNSGTILIDTEGKYFYLMEVYNPCAIFARLRYCQLYSIYDSEKSAQQIVFSGGVQVGMSVADLNAVTKGIAYTTQKSGGLVARYYETDTFKFEIRVREKDKIVTYIRYAVKH